jgi:hypothetical protein
MSKPRAALRSNGYRVALRSLEIERSRAFAEICGKRQNRDLTTLTSRRAR